MPVKTTKYITENGKTYEVRFYGKIEAYWFLNKKLSRENGPAYEDLWL